MLTLTACMAAPTSDRSKIKVEVTKISKAVFNEIQAASYDPADLCESWSLTATQAEEFFAISEAIDSPAYNHEYDTAPCNITGTLVEAGHIWQFEINGAAKARLTSGKDERYVGCRKSACKKLVLWEFVGLDP